MSIKRHWRDFLDGMGYALAEQEAGLFGAIRAGLRDVGRYWSPRPPVSEDLGKIIAAALPLAAHNITRNNALLQYMLAHPDSDVARVAMRIEPS